MMKKILLFIIILVLLCLLAVYVFIPGRITISVNGSAGCIPKNVAECLRGNNELRRWWPKNISDTQQAGDFLTYKKYNYKLITPFTDGAEIELSKGEKKFETRIRIVPSGKDSSAVEWQISFESGLNPFKRTRRYFEANEIKYDLHNLLDTLVRFAGNTENIYGFHIVRTTFTDTILLATRFTTKVYPSVETVYEHINELREKN